MTRKTPQAPLVEEPSSGPRGGPEASVTPPRRRISNQNLLNLSQEDMRPHRSSSVSVRTMSNLAGPRGQGEDEVPPHFSAGVSSITQEQSASFGEFTRDSFLPFQEMARPEEVRKTTSVDSGMTLVGPSGTVVTFEQVQLLKEAFQLVRPIRVPATERFYDEFFKIHPEAEAIFPSNAFRKRAKVVKMMERVANSLPAAPSRLDVELRVLGRLHYDLQAPIDMYDGARVAFLRVVEPELRKAGRWDEEMEAAFIALIDVISDKMFAGYPRELVKAAQTDVLKPGLCPVSEG